MQPLALWWPPLGNEVLSFLRVLFFLFLSSTLNSDAVRTEASGHNRQGSHSSEGGHYEGFTVDTKADDYVMYLSCDTYHDIHNRDS